MNPQTSGWRTSEFWVTALTQLVALLAAVGFVAAGDKTTLEGAITNAVTAAFAFIAAAIVIVRYIAARFDLKSQVLEQAHEAKLAGPADKPADVGSRPTLPPVAPMLFLAALAAWLVASPVQAQQPAPAAATVKTASLFGWREAIQIEQLKGQLERQREENSDMRAQLGRLEALLLTMQSRPAPQVQTPAPPQVMIIALPQQGGPQQQLPIAGPPLQHLPIQGPPLQQLPIAGPPLQQLPIAGPPLQQLPQQGPPLQVLPIGGGAPLQQLGPPGQARPQIGEARPAPPPQVMPPADAAPPRQLLPTGRPQRYVPAIARR